MRILPEVSAGLVPKFPSENHPRGSSIILSFFKHPSRKCSTPFFGIFKGIIMNFFFSNKFSEIYSEILSRILPQIFSAIFGRSSEKISGGASETM